MDMTKSVKAAALGLAALTLVGCAHAQTSGMSQTGDTPGTPTPDQVLVEVSTTPQATPQDTQELSTAATGMQSALLQGLAKEHMAASIYNPALDLPGVLVLHAVITSANPGNAAERLDVGFGAGAAQVQMNVRVRPGGQAAGSTEEFDLSSKNGAKPGLILPAGIALVTHNPLHMAIGGAVDLAMNRRTGISPAESKAASQVMDELKNYYAAQGWIWAAPAP